METILAQHLEHRNRDVPSISFKTFMRQDR